jgi:hypothetical protein
MRWRASGPLITASVTRRASKIASLPAQQAIFGYDNLKESREQLWRVPKGRHNL